MRYLDNIVQLFYPDFCINCDCQLVKGEKILCLLCLHDLPFLDIYDVSNNKIKNTFFGKVPIQNAVSFLIFRKKGVTKKLIHELKYKGNQEIGKMLGERFGMLLKEKDFFTNIDFIVPVPLHKKRFKERGYNQLTTFGETLSDILNIPYKPNILQRISASKTQTLHKRFERFTNADTKFYLSDTSIFENKKVLVIDDVITTGATLTSCCEELLKSKGIKLNIATMAYTKHI